MSSTEYARSAADGKTSIPTYSLLMAPKVPTKSKSETLRATTVLLDTGASVSLMPAWQAAALKLQVTPRSDIVIRGADGRRLIVNGTSEIWVRDPAATFWKKVKVVVTRDGSWTLISPRDQKRLWLLHQNYPQFLGTGRFRRPDAKAHKSDGATSDSSSESESDTECEEAPNTRPTSVRSNVNTTDSTNKNNIKTTPESTATDTVYSVSTDEGFSTDLPPDEVEVEYDGEGMTIKWGEGLGGEEHIRDACVDAICTQLGSVCARQLVEEGLAALVNNSPGESDDGDDDLDDADSGPDIDENELIAQKTEFERDFILEFRDLFSESLSPTIIYEPHQCVFHLKIPLIDPVTRPYMV